VGWIRTLGDLRFGYLDGDEHKSRLPALDDGACPESDSTDRKLV